MKMRKVTYMLTTGEKKKAYFVPSDSYAKVYVTLQHTNSNFAGIVKYGEVKEI